MARKTKSTAAPFAFDGLDRVIHEKARLGILSSLVGHPKGLSFADLKRLCDLTDGNLSRHIQVLEDAKLVAVRKGFEGKRPHTTCQLTQLGRKKFNAYLDVLEGIVRDTGRERSRARHTNLTTAKPQTS